MKVNYYLQGKKPKLKPIIALFRRNDILVKVNIGIQIAVKHWDKKKQRVKNVINEPNRDSINFRLNTIQNNFQKLYLEHCFQNPTKGNIKEILIESIRGKKIDKVTLFDFFDTHINELSRKTNLITGKPINSGTVNKFEVLKKRLYEFNSSLDFEKITKSFYIDFTEWLRVEKDLNPNTIGKYIRALKEVLNRATEAGYNKNEDYKDKSFKILHIETDKIALTENELNKIFDLDLSNNLSLDNVRNLFLIGCYTGVRFSDIEKIKDNVLANPESEEITITPEKTGQKITIPILKITRNLINRNPHIISNQKLNQYIKEVGKLAKIDNLIPITTTKGVRTETVSKPKYNLISSHTARRSFATISLKKGISPKVIMSITGHKKEENFYKYIKMSGVEYSNLLRDGWEKN